MRQRGRVAVGLIVAVIVSVACAPDRSADLQTDGAPITQAVQDAASAAGIADCPDSVGDDDSELGRVELSCLTTGDAVNLASFEGPVLVNLWAHWCEPCREEMPLLVRAAEEYAGRVTFVGVVFADENPAAAVDLAASLGVTFPQLADPGSLLRVPLSLRGLPTTVFIRDGEILGSQLTPYEDYGVLVDDIAEHLEVEQ